MGGDFIFMREGYRLFLLAGLRCQDKLGRGFGRLNI